MNKQIRFAVWIVMIAALVLIVFCSMNYISLGKQLHSLDRQLAESRERWEKTAEEKEALLVGLEADKKKLSQAQRTLEDKLKEAEEVRSDIDQLLSEIENLKLEKSVAE